VINLLKERLTGT